MNYLPMLFSFFLVPFCCGMQDHLSLLSEATTAQGILHQNPSLQPEAWDETEIYTEEQIARLEREFPSETPSLKAIAQEQAHRILREAKTLEARLHSPAAFSSTDEFFSSALNLKRSFDILMQTAQQTDYLKVLRTIRSYDLAQQVNRLYLLAIERRMDAVERELRNSELLSIALINQFESIFKEGLSRVENDKEIAREKKNELAQRVRRIHAQIQARHSAFLNQ